MDLVFSQQMAGYLRSIEYDDKRAADESFWAGGSTALNPNKISQKVC